MADFKVGFSRPKRWMPYAWLIMKGYGVQYDHVYIRIRPQGLDRDVIFQASGLSVNFMSAATFEGVNVVVDEFPVSVSDDRYLDMMRFAVDQAGKPYGIMEAVGLAAVRVAAVLGFKIKNPFRDGEKTWVCSTLAAYALEKFAGAALDPVVDDVSPPEVYAYFAAMRESESGPGGG